MAVDESRWAHNNEIYPIGDFVCIPEEDKHHAFSGKGDFEILDVDTNREVPCYTLDIAHMGYERNSWGNWNCNRFVASK